MTDRLACALVGTYDQFDSVGGIDKVAVVAQPDDDFTSHIHNWHAGYRQSYLLSVWSMPSGSTINKVTVHTRAGTAESTPGIYIGSFLYLAGQNNDASPHYHGYGFGDFDDEISRPGGGPWSLSDLATLEIGVYVATMAWADCSTMYADIDYTPPTGDPKDGMIIIFN